MIQFQEALKLEPTSISNPEPETKSMIHGLALRAKSEERCDLVRHLREITPDGTTGEFKEDEIFSHRGGGIGFWDIRSTHTSVLLMQH